MISEDGETAAAPTPANELPEVQAHRDAADVADLHARQAAPTGPSMLHDTFMAQLEAEDRQAVATRPDAAREIRSGGTYRTTDVNA